jgi:hypothetical protein
VSFEQSGRPADISSLKSFLLHGRAFFPSTPNLACEDSFAQPSDSRQTAEGNLITGYPLIVSTVITVLRRDASEI